MRLMCWECGKGVSTEVPKCTIVRATIVCPECFVLLCDRIAKEIITKLSSYEANNIHEDVKH